MRIRYYILTLLLLAATMFAVSRWSFRLDLTEDKRYSLSDATKTLMHDLDAPVQVRLLLTGRLNPSFVRLKNATCELLDDLGRYGNLTYNIAVPDPSDKGVTASLSPIVIHERQQQGQTVQTPVFPYAVVRYKGRETVVQLLNNTRGLSGEENVNRSIEQLEFAFAEALQQISRNETERIAFLEGHGEMSEREVYDVSLSLSKFFDIDRGSLTGDVNDILPYKAIIIASPQERFSEADKYQLDQYVMRGGRILWVIDGVQFSEDILSSDGYTPVIQKDLNLQDILFRYGVRVTPTLLQDKQCLPVPVDVSTDATQPNFQPMPWFYAPLLLTSQASPVTHNLGSVSALFCSGVEFVGGDDGLRKEALLATSSSSRAIVAPAEVDLSLADESDELFTHAFIPVAVLVEGSFPSLFQHRMAPEGVIPVEQQAASTSTRQIVVACSSIIHNDWQQNTPLPAGYDRYTGMQFANRDFITNATLYLTDNNGLINLRQKDYTLRLLNDRRAHEARTRIQTATCVVPLIVLALLQLLINFFRKLKFTRE